jgi:hypothetical protein
MGSLSLMAVSVLPCSNPLYLQKYSKKVIYVHEMIIIFIFSVFFIFLEYGLNRQDGCRYRGSCRDDHRLAEGHKKTARADKRYCADVGC